MDITSIGDINLDLITSLGEIPERDSQRIVNEISLSSGGCAANFAKAISRLGLSVRFIGKLGNDILAEFVVNSMQGVDLKISTGSKTGLTFAMTFEDNTRSFITYPGSNSELGIHDINLELIEGKYLHIASPFLQGLRENTSELFRYAHKRGMTTSFDTGWDPEGWSESDMRMVRGILREVDIFFPNLKEGEAITGVGNKREVCEELLGLGPEIIALKLGSEGSYIATEKERIPTHPFRVDVVDTTGAGDVFDAAFIYGHFRGWDLKRIGRFANTAAALSTRGYGSEKYPDVEEVGRLMEGFYTSSSKFFI